MKVRIKDVAERAGCSPSLVSSVLNNRIGNIRFSANVAKRIQRVAEELGYRTPRERAPVQLKNRKYVALMSYSDESNLNNYYSGVFIGFFSSLINDAGYEVCLLPLESKERSSKLRNLRKMEKELSGIVVLHHSPDSEAMKFIQKSGIPYLFANCGQLEGNNCIVMDDDGACVQIVRFLRACAKKNILFISTDRNRHSCVAAREKAVTRECADLEINISLKINHYELTEEILDEELKKGIDCILTTSTSYAKDAIMMLMRLGKSVPEDIGVVAADDFQGVEESSLYKITHLKIPFPKMAELAAKKMLNMLNAGLYEFENVYLPEYLFIGDTCFATNN